MSYYMGSDYFFRKIGFNPEKETRLLRDAFYETRIVNRAILESTGQRYLNDTKNEKDQMQMLFENAIEAMDDLNLSIGKALTTEQINNLESDIVWYVEEEVSGINVLVPKVYLSKKTLALLGNNQTGMMAGNSINISAVEVTNTGSINAGGKVTINADEFLNKSILGNFKAIVSGNDVEIVTVNDISNIGGDLKAINNLTLESLQGNIINNSTVRTYEIGTHKFSNVENVATITAGNNVKIAARENFDITGGLVEAGKDVSVEAKNINLNTIELYDYNKIGGGKNYTITEKTANVGSAITGDNISLFAKKDINVIGSNIVAENSLIAVAGENINVTASIDSNYYEHQESKKKSFGRSSSNSHYENFIKIK